VDPYIAVMIGGGGLILLVAWLPMLLRELPLSLPIVCVGIGWALFALLPTGDDPRPRLHPEEAERLTELLVIVALMGCGLKLDRPLGRRRWAATWRLLAVAMPLSIAATAAIGHAAMGLPIAAALLFAAAMAPTDPVLASDVQVGPPGSGEEDEVRFALTSEAGLNDGLAFPFVNLAIAIALHAGTAVPADRDADPSTLADLLLHWAAVDVVWRIAGGVAIGWAIGLGLGQLAFRLPNRARLSRTGDGFLALAMTFLSYGLAQTAGTYGFVAVFVTALAFRSVERDHEHHRQLHDFAEQTERLFMMAVLVLFGGALAEGLLAPLDLAGALTGLALLFVVRPLATWASLPGLGWRRAEVWTVGFFGIRGVGSFYYLTHAFNQAGWAPADVDRIWAACGFAVLVSIVVHGMTVTPVMRAFDRLGPGRKGDARGAPGA
jgi:NhaP-type Na+/H+ or K+/H+ antiporter